MPTSIVTGPDGKDYEVTHPAGASDEDIIRYAQQSLAGPSSPTRLTTEYSPPDPEKSQLKQWMNKAAIPAAATGVAALATGGMATLPALAIQTGASVAGEGINQLTGITEPSAQDLALAGAGPSVGLLGGKALGYALSKGMKHVPGAGYAAQDIATRKMADLPNKLNIEPSAPAYSELERLINTQGASIVPTANLNAAVQKTRADMAPLIDALKTRGYNNIAQQLDSLIQSSGSGTIPLDVLRKNLSAIGEDLGAMSSEFPKSGHGILSQIYKGGMRDIEALAASGDDQALQALKAAKLYKREGAQRQLRHWIEGSEPRDFRPKVGAIKTRGTDLERFSRPGDVSQKIRGSEEFRERLTPDELAMLEKELTKVASYPQLPSPNDWSSFRRRLAVSALLGGSAGYAGGAGTGTLVGLGVLGGLEGIEQAAKTKAGRALVRRLMENQIGSGAGSRAAGSSLMQMFNED